MPQASSTSRDSNTNERDLLVVVRELVGELQPDRVKFVDISPSSRLERDLGIDSLGRTELILRIERAFAVRLPLQIVTEAETVGDLLRAVEQAHPGRAPAEPQAPPVPSLPKVGAALEARTLVEVLDWHVKQHPDRLHVTVLQDQTTVLGTMTYGELAQAARAVAAGLIGRDIAPGDRIALMLPTGLEFFAAFLGILHAGAVPVPIYPPTQLSQIEDHVRRQAGILRNAEARMLITVYEGLRVASLMRGLVTSLDAVESVASLSVEPGQTQLPPSQDAAAIALIQYTSGSTGDPKGVVLSHGNLLANIRSLGRAINANSADVLFSWLPLYHDMGLIGAWLGCLYFGAPFYVMSPLSFLARPESWLWGMHRFRATISAAPNFAFELCLSKIDDANLTGLDLSSLRFVANGAEPVNVQTLRRFIERFGRYGFRGEAMAPVYGLAENAVALALPPPGRPPIIDRVDREALIRRSIAEPASRADTNVIEIVACGQPMPDHEIRIVDDFGREIGERHEGRLEFRGPSATSGYFKNESKTRELFDHGWLDSGDRAYIAGGDVYITGRIKDIIIRAGQHIYPQEVEMAVADVQGIRVGGVAAFGMTDPVYGTERVVILAETDESDPVAVEKLRARARGVASEILGGPPDEILLVRPKTVPKTASGKIRRAAAKNLYANRLIDVPRRTLRWQIYRLWLAGLGTKVSRLSVHLGKILYAAWWWTVMGLGFVLGSLAVMLLPRLTWRWAALRGLARAAFAAIGAPLSVSGIEHLPRGNAVIVFNHASYIDSLVVAAVLPAVPTFVAKKELAGQLFAGPLLRRLGALFIERYEAAESLADAEAVAAVARQGRVLVFFPEGSITRRMGLSAFYLGAFKVAAEANLPVVPGVLRGTRSMLRSDQWFPRWAPIGVEIGEAIAPRGTDFASMVTVRDTAREFMLARCGEPDLGELLKVTSA
jgi:1-acyl-sn-glycerol-3-phosphate acyltransferase